MTFEHILFDIDDGVAFLRLNRPEQLNSFNAQMHAEVKEALKQVRANAQVRVLLLTGEGRGFCAGQDLSDRNVAPGAQMPDLGESIEKFYNPLIRALRDLPLPVICAVNGVAAGAGAKEAAKSAGVFWKQEAEILRQVRSWRLELLDEVQDSVNAADIATKTTGMPEALIAERLGATQVPRSRAEVAAYLAAVRPELLCDERSLEILRILLNAPAPSALAAPAAKLLMQAGIDLLPDWAQQMLGQQISPSRSRMIHTGVHSLAPVLRWAVRGGAIHRARKRLNLPPR
mgnify:CR=1 FL=1